MRTSASRNCVTRSGRHTERGLFTGISSPRTSFSRLRVAPGVAFTLEVLDFGIATFLDAGAVAKTTRSAIGAMPNAGQIAATGAAPAAVVDPTDDSRFTGGPTRAQHDEMLRAARDVITRSWGCAQQRIPGHPTEYTDVNVSVGVVERVFETRLPGLRDIHLRNCIQAEMLRARFPHITQTYSFRLRVTLTPD